tara:strand:- start:26 stop:208 length:183 start_codon:yes stop_codon:yes gene_type:complete
MKSAKVGYNQKMIGKTIETHVEDEIVMAIVESVVDEEMLKVRNIKTHETFKVSIFDVRGT